MVKIISWKKIEERKSQISGRGKIVFRKINCGRKWCSKKCGRKKLSKHCGRKIKFR